MTGVRVPGVLFVDLDGTLLLDNSFHLFVWSLWLKGGSRLRWGLVKAAFVRLLACRDPRVRMKRSILHAFFRSPVDRRQAVVNHTLRKMTPTISRPVLERISSYRDKGWYAVLATAAPECYARPFAEILGLDDCLASPEVEYPEDWFELIGARKAEACKAWAAGVVERAPVEIAAITDHPDDLPLLRLCSHVVIQAPPADAEELIHVLSEKVSHEHIDPVGVDRTGGMWLWINDGPSGPFDEWEVRTILSKHRYALLYRSDMSWRRALPGQSLHDAATRLDCPRPPGARIRVSVAARRFVVRDLLGVYH